MLAKEIIKKVRQIEIRTRHLVNDVFAGEYHSVFKGRGMEFQEVREYEPGDDIRTIDWNVTARMGHPFIKKFSEERELTVMLLVDISSSNLFGSQTQLKKDLSAEIAAVLAFAAIRNNDRVGLILFSDEVEKFLPPQKGSSHVLRVVRDVLGFRARRRGTALLPALDYLNHITTRKTVTFLISDFLTREDLKATLRASAARHDLIAVIAADRNFSTDRAIAMATYARGVGADIYMALPPDWALSCTPETLAEHYAAVARVMPVMLVTNVYVAHGQAFGLETVKRAMEAENVLAIKDDMCGDFAHRLCHLAYGRLNIIAGGLKENHMNMWPYGVDGYLSTFINIKPQIAWNYWNAIQANDLAEARHIIFDIDTPFFDYLMTIQGSFDAALHAVDELYGRTKRWRRKPYYSLNDAEMDALAAFMRGMGLLS